MKSAAVDGISDYKDTHLHFYISPSINSFICIGPLPSWSYDIISSEDSLDSYGIYTRPHQLPVSIVSHVYHSVAMS